MTTIIAIMVAAGLLGGALATLQPTAERTWQSATREFVQRLIAVLTVPLFLSLSKSPLTKDAINGDELATLHFAGFCLLASITAKAFLGRVREIALGETKMSWNREKRYLDGRTTCNEMQVSKCDTSSPVLPVQSRTIVCAMERGSRKYHTDHRIATLVNQEAYQLTECLKNLRDLGLISSIEYGDTEAWYVTNYGREYMLQSQSQR